MELMQHKNYVVLHNALYLIKEKSLVIADLHLSYDESIKNEGVLIPLTANRKLMQNLLNIITTLEQNKYEVANIVFNGDIKHEFASVLRFEDKAFKDLLSFSKRHRLYFVKGNHDAILDAFFAKQTIAENVFVCDGLVTENYFIVHGDASFDELFVKDKKMIELSKNKAIGLADKATKTKLKKLTLIIGHEHPVIYLSDNVRKERYKALLVSEKVIILPAFNPLIEGTDFNSAFRAKKFLSPILDEIKVKDYDVYLFGDDIDSDIFEFGKLSKLV